MSTPLIGFPTGLEFIILFAVVLVGALVYVMRTSRQGKQESEADMVENQQERENPEKKE